MELIVYQFQSHTANCAPGYYGSVQGLTTKECIGRCANGRYSTGGAVDANCHGKCKAGSWSNVLTKPNASGAGRECTPCRADHYGDEDGATMATCSGECPGAPIGSTSCHLHSKTTSRPMPTPTPKSNPVPFPSPSVESKASLPNGSAASTLNMVFIPLSIIMAMILLGMCYYLYKKERASPGTRTSPVQDEVMPEAKGGNDRAQGEESPKHDDKADEAQAPSAVHHLPESAGNAQKKKRKNHKKKQKSKTHTVYVVSATY